MLTTLNNARYALQLCLCALFTMLEDAAGEALSNMSAYEWLCEKSTESEVYLYWKMVIELEIGILIYITAKAVMLAGSRYSGLI